MLQHAREITRSAFYNHVSVPSLRQLAVSLGYHWQNRRGPTLMGQPDIKMYRSKLHGRDVFYLTHGGVLYLFAKVTNHVRKT